MTGQQLIILRQELLSDPLGIGYADMSDDQAADALNAKTRTAVVSRHASWRTLAGVLTDDEYAEAKAAAAQAASQSQRVADMLAMLDLPCDEAGNTGGLDFGHPDVRAMIDALPIAATVKAKVKAIAEYAISRAEELGLGFVKPGHVQMARGT